MDSKMRVLIGYDGSEHSENAIQNLKTAGLPQKGLVTVVSAADVFLPEGSDAGASHVLARVIQKARTKAKDALRVAQSISEHGAKQVKKVLPGWKVVADATADAPAWAIIKKADDWKADLIILGAHGHAKWGRFIGSVSQIVLVHAKQSVRISRPRPADAAEPRIVIGVDGSNSSKKVVNTVLERAWPAKAQVLLMSVVEPKMSVVDNSLMATEIRWMFEEADDKKEAAGKMLENFAKKFRQKGFQARCQVGLGDPKQALVNEAKAWGADSIFIGARGLGEMKRFLIGGVSTAVATRAHCSVEVIR